MKKEIEIPNTLYSKLSKQAKRHGKTVDEYVEDAITIQLVQDYEFTTRNNIKV